MPPMAHRSASKVVHAALSNHAETMKLKGWRNLIQTLHKDRPRRSPIETCRLISVLQQITTICIGFAVEDHWATVPPEVLGCGFFMTSVMGARTYGARIAASLYMREQNDGQYCCWSIERMDIYGIDSGSFIQFGHMGLYYNTINFVSFVITYVSGLTGCFFWYLSVYVSQWICVSKF